MANQRIISKTLAASPADVVRLTVRTVDGREFEVETIAAPDELGWNDASTWRPSRLTWSLERQE